MKKVLSILMALCLVLTIASCGEKGKQCSNCGEDILKNAEFCHHCGASQDSSSSQITITENESSDTEGASSQPEGTTNSNTTTSKDTTSKDTTSNNAISYQSSTSAKKTSSVETLTSMVHKHDYTPATCTKP